MQQSLSIFLRREFAKLASGRGDLWPSLLLFVFLSALGLILLSGVLSGVDLALQVQVKAGALWLLLFAVLAWGASSLFKEDAADGTLDQDVVAAKGSYISLIIAALVTQALMYLIPLSLIFLGIWAVGLGASLPIATLSGLIVPLLSLRLLASAAALGAGRSFGGGDLLFLGLSSPLLLLAVAGQPGLIWATGLILSALSLGLAPFALSLGHGAR